MPPINPITVEFHNKGSGKKDYEAKLNVDAARDFLIEQLKPAEGVPPLNGNDNPEKQEDFEKRAIGVLNGLTLDVLRTRKIVTNKNDTQLDDVFSLEDLGNLIIGAIGEKGVEAILLEAGWIDKPAPPPISDNLGAAATGTVKTDAPNPNPADAKKGVTGEPAAADESEADETGDIEGERVDEGALGDQGSGGEGPKKPGFWARFGSWILGGLGILSAIGAFFAHAEGKARAFFAILGGLLLGGAIVNQWHGFGKAIFGGTDAKKQPDAANPALEPDAEPQPT